MRDYELMVILHPDLDNEAITGTMDRLKERISALGELTAADLLGRRRLAYVVRKQTQGMYALLNFTSDPAQIAVIKQFMRVDLHDQVIRFLLVKDEKRGTRPPAQPLPGDEEQEEELSDEERMARAAAERAALEEAAMAQAAQEREQVVEQTGEDVADATADEAPAEPEAAEEEAAEDSDDEA